MATLAEPLLAGVWKMKAAAKKGQGVKVDVAVAGQLEVTVATNYAIGILTRDHKAGEYVSAYQINIAQVVECKLNAAVAIGALIGPAAAGDFATVASGHIVGQVQKVYADNDLAQVFVLNIFVNA